MVFRARNARTYKLRIDAPDGRHGTFSTACTVRDDALDVEAVVRRWCGRKGKRHARPDVVDAILDRRVTLATAYDASLAGTLDALLEAHPARALDVGPRVAEWKADKAKSGRGAGQSAAYDKQLRALYPEIDAGAFSLALFSTSVLWARLDALDVAPPTRNRYRAAASSFAAFLTKRGVIARNFVRDIPGFGERPPRLVYYEIDDARRLIEGMPQPYAAIAAAALGFCMEWRALDRATVADFTLDVDPPTARVRGSKRAWRDRVVPLVPELRWTLDVIRSALARKLAAAPAFDGVPEWRAIDVQRAAAADLELVAVGEREYGAHSIHDWRQTHAVALLRWGYGEQIAAAHLGHKNTSLVRENYGRFVPTKHDYARRQSSTNSATTPSRAKGKR